MLIFFALFIVNSCCFPLSPFVISSVLRFMHVKKDFQIFPRLFGAKRENETEVYISRGHLDQQKVSVR
jgi:hypothetical protein